jgi:anti-sigma B factor antagonist
MDHAVPGIRVEYRQNSTIVMLMEEKILQEVDIQVLENSIMPLIEESGKIKLVMDFCNVRFLTSSALGLLIRISKKVYESEGSLKLCSIDPKIFEVFRITRLDKVFDIYDELDQAVDSFESQTDAECGK